MTDETPAPQDPEAAAEDVKGELVEFEDGTGGLLTPSRNYGQAVDMGHVLAQSGLFKDASDPAKCAVKVMFGMDLGISPTAAMSAIHLIPSDGRIVPIIEGKLLGGIIKNREGYDYEVIEYTDEKCTLRFSRDGKDLHPDVTWTKEDSQRAGLLSGKKAEGPHKKYPRAMNYWRALAEGQRLHFPEITAGAPIYVQEEMGADETTMREAIMPPGPKPLADEQAEAQRAEAKSIYDELRELNPERLVPGRFAAMVKGAEHSHEQLGVVIEALADLRDCERQIVQLKADLEASDAPASAVKAAIDRAERQSNQRERISVLETALEEAGATVTDAEVVEGGDTDGAGDGTEG